MTEPVIQCARLTKRFSDALAVSDVDLELRPGEILSVLGPSGSGKTTLLRLIAGFEVPDSGEVRIHGRPVSGSGFSVPPESRNVGMVFQEYALFPKRTVSQNVAFGLRGLPDRERRKRVAEAIELVRLTGMDDRYPHELSGGQQQRVALARTLAPRPIAVLLDEPFSNLDAGMRREMRQEVEGILREDSIATVFVTHDREEAFAMADRVGVMIAGHLEQLDQPEVIYRSPATPFVAELAGMCDFLRGQVQDDFVVTEIGKLAYTSNNGALPQGSRVDLLVHPNDFQVMPHPEGTSVVLSREFRGDETVLVVRMPSGATLRCHQRSHTAIARGARVTLSPENTIPFLVFKT